MRFSSHPVVFLAVSLAAGGLAADVYRCTGSDGETMFSQSPCGGSGVASVIHPAPSAGAASGLRAAELDWLARRERERERARAGERRAKPSARAADSNADRRDCERRRMALDDINARLRRGYRPAQGERLKQRRRMLEQYIDRVCRR
jgi:hypothetical protein